jgi:hypothetical protein
VFLCRHGPHTVSAVYSAALATMRSSPAAGSAFVHEVKLDGLFRQECAIGFEGVISKRSDEPYRSGRGRDWFKVKRLLRQ